MVGFVLTMTERETLTLTLVSDSPEYMHNDFVGMELRNRTMIFDHSGETKQRTPPPSIFLGCCRLNKT